MIDLLKCFFQRSVFDSTLAVNIGYQDDFIDIGIPILINSSICDEYEFACNPLKTRKEFLEKDISDEKIVSCLEKKLTNSCYVVEDCDVLSKIQKNNSLMKHNCMLYLDKEHSYDKAAIKNLIELTKYFTVIYGCIFEIEPILKYLKSNFSQEIYNRVVEKTYWKIGDIIKPNNIQQNFCTDTIQAGLANRIIEPKIKQIASFGSIIIYSDIVKSLTIFDLVEISPTISSFEISKLDCRHTHIEPQSSRIDQILKSIQSMLCETMKYSGCANLAELRKLNLLGLEPF